MSLDSRDESRASSQVAGFAVALLLGFTSGSATAGAFGSDLGIAADEFGVLALPPQVVVPQRVAEVGDLRHLPSIYEEPVEFRRAPSAEGRQRSHPRRRSRRSRS